MFPLALSEPLCNRTQSCRYRSSSIEDALVEEYLDCFSRTHLTEKQGHALLRCMESAVPLAHATVIPIIFQDALNNVQNLHPVIIAVCTHFFGHLRHSWFALENARVDEMYAHLRRFTQF